MAHGQVKQLLKHYLRTGKYHPSTPDYKKRGIRKASHNFILKGPSLIYVGKGRMQVVCRNDEDKQNAIEWCHNNRENDKEPCSIRDTIKMLQSSYYWHGLNKDIEKKLYPCEKCTTNVHRISLNSSGHVPSLGTFRQLNVVKEEKLAEDSSPVGRSDVFKSQTSEPASEQSSDNENSVHPSFFQKEAPSFHSPVHAKENHHSCDSDDAFPPSSLSNSTINSRAIEMLLERISQLQSLNAALIDENHMLKDRIKSLHVALENQKSLPLLQDLIRQLKNAIAQPSCSKQT